MIDHNEHLNHRTHQHLDTQSPHDTRCQPNAIDSSNDNTLLKFADHILRQHPIVHSVCKQILAALVQAFALVSAMVSATELDEELDKELDWESVGW